MVLRVAALTLVLGGGLLTTVAHGRLRERLDTLSGGCDAAANLTAFTECIELLQSAAIERATAGRAMMMAPRPPRRADRLALGDRLYENALGANVTARRRLRRRLVNELRHHSQASSGRSNRTERADRGPDTFGWRALCLTPEALEATAVAARTAADYSFSDASSTPARCMWTPAPRMRVR